MKHACNFYVLVFFVNLSCASTVRVPALAIHQLTASQKGINIFMDGTDSSLIGDIRAQLPEYDLRDIPIQNDKYSAKDICISMTTVELDNEIYKNIFSVLTLTGFPYQSLKEIHIELRNCVSRYKIYSNTIVLKRSYGILMPLSPLFKTSEREIKIFGIALIIKHGLSEITN